MKRMIAVLALLCCCSGQILAQSVAEKEVLDLEKQWIQAIVSHDVTFMEKLLAPNFISVGPEGVISTRQTVLEEWRKSKKRNIISLTPVEEKVFITGETAVYSYTDIIVQIKEDKEIKETVRGMDVFAHVDGRWMCVNMSFVALKEAETAK